MCVCVSVRPFFFLLVSLEFFLVPKSFNAVSRKFKRCLKFQGCFKVVLRVFTESFNSVSSKFQECFKEVSEKFQGCLKNISRVFEL